MVHVPVEFQLLMAAVIIGLVQLIWAATAGATGVRDPAWLLGPRDDPRPMSGAAARLDRAFKNFLETFPLFAVALISTYIAGKLGPLTMYGSALYVICRAIYAPLYVSGIAVVRTVVWTASMVGIAMIILAFFR